MEDSISANDAQEFRTFLSILDLPKKEVELHLQRLADLKLLKEIQHGDLPAFQTSVRFPADEICHYEAPAVYFRGTQRGSVPTQGTLVITSKRLIFLSAWKTLNISWGDVARSTPTAEGFLLELWRGVGTGPYSVQSQSVINSLLSILLDRLPTEIDVTDAVRSRSIAKDVKEAVWLRDGGRCIECQSSDNLQFDHIIPFSKGGANTLENIQILCQTCNLKKSDRL